MQGVGQHAGHTLHHHLIGGLQESRGWGLGPACLRNWHSGEAQTLMAEKPGSPRPAWGHSTSDVPFVTHPQFPPPRDLLGSMPGPVAAEVLWESLQSPL